MAEETRIWRLGQAKLNFEKAMEIARRLQDGELQADLAKAYGVSVPTISRIKNSRTWKERVEKEEVESAS